MFDAIEMRVNDWAEDLWPGSWPYARRLYLTCGLVVFVAALAVLSVWLLYSSV